MTATAAQVTMAVWLLFGAGLFGSLVLKPRTIRLAPAQCSRVATFALGGVIGEAVTLWIGGFFHV